MLQVHVGWWLDMQKKEKVVKDKLALRKVSVDNLIIISSVSQFVNAYRKCL
jgi:hypothetical protein